MKGLLLMHFLIVNMNKLDLIRFLQKTKKIFFVNFPGSLWSYRVGCSRFFLFRMRKIASVCKPVCLYYTFLFSKERRFLKRFQCARAAAAVFAAGGKIVFLADFASLCLCIEYRTSFSEKREFARLRSCRYSRKRFEMSFLKVSLMYDVCMLIHAYQCTL